MKPDRITFYITVATFLVGIGVTWASMAARFDAMDKRIEQMERDRNEGLCLTVLRSQISAVEKGNTRVRSDLSRLSDQYCPTARPDPVGAVQPETEAERLARDRRYKADLSKISEINDELNCSVENRGRRIGQPGYNPRGDRDGDGVSCE